MLDQCIQHGFRLNRFIGASFLFYAALTAITLWDKTLQPEHPLLAAILLGASAVLTLAMLAVNELSFTAFKKISRPDPMVLDKMSLLMPLLVNTFLGASYLLLGQVGPLLFLTFTVLYSQLMGHLRLARVAIIVSSVVFAVSLFLGYPKLFTLSFAHLSLHHANPLLFLQTLPFLMTLIYHCQVMTTLMRSTTDRVYKLQSLAATDGLTGLVNRRQFNHQLQAEIARARRHKTPLTLALFDIDDFKKINDFYGHPVGDRILKELGELITQNVRESDTPARYGGEEFALILPETRQAEAAELLERIRELIERTVFCLPDNPITATISVGVAQLDPKNSTVFDLIEASDNCLYEAKKRGKNQVVYGMLPTPKLQMPSSSVARGLPPAM